MKLTMIHTSDLHGTLPNIPPCDVLTISGDICPNFSHQMMTEITAQADWLRRVFKPWLKGQPVSWTIATFGNHDWIGYHYDSFMAVDAPVFWLMDQGVTHQGLRFYGTPWTLAFQDWAFNLNEDQLAIRFGAIEPCDVLLTHSPPYGYGDKAPPIPAIGQYHDVRVGSPSLLKRIEEIQPQLCVFGHIHPGSGVYRHQGIPLANMTVVDRNYLPLNPLLRSTWEDGKLLDLEPCDHSGG